MLESRENAIEFLYGDKMATATFCSPRHINRVKKLAEQFPDECQIVVENSDSSIVAHFPVKWIRIQKPNQRDLTEEERAEIRERFLNGRNPLFTKGENE